MKNNYKIFGAMILTSTVIMYLLMYLHTYQFSHVQWSETRFYMTLIMGSVMAVVMLAFMGKMYDNKTVNFSIYVGSTLVFILSLFLVRSQVTVESQSWMRGMIPHHSIAILTSERAELEDVRVKALASEIIQAQEREIKEMEWLIEDIQKNGLVTSESEAEQRPIPDFSSSAP